MSAKGRDALEESVHAGRLKREPSSSTEIKGFLDHAKRALADASVPGVSATGRFEFAYTAAHALALAGLRMRDLRPGSGPGHRAIVFLSLPQTVGAPETLASSLNRYHTRRNKSEYGDWSAASEAEADDLLALARRLQGTVAERARKRGLQVDASDRSSTL